MKMVYEARQCPQCLLHAVMWHYGPLVFCPACGPVPPSALTADLDLSRRMKALADRVAANEAEARAIGIELADVMQQVELTLWFAMIRPCSPSCAQVSAARNGTETANIEKIENNQCPTDA